MISKTADSTNFNSGSPLGLSIKGKKAGRVNDLSLFGFPWQMIYIRGFLPNFAKKRLKITKSSNGCQSFRITTKTLKLLEIIFRFMYFSEN